MRRISLVCCALVSVLFTAALPASAQSVPSVVVIVSDGAKGAEIACPIGRTVRVRLEGRDAANKVVAIDPKKIEWASPKSTAFEFNTDSGYAYIVARKDAFDTGEEPSSMLSAKYLGRSAAVVLHSVINVEGKWQLKVTSDVINLNLRQSGRWVVDNKGRRGTIHGKVLRLRIEHEIRVIGIPITLTLHPVVEFTSRTEGVGTVKVPNKIEKLYVTKLP